MGSVLKFLLQPTLCRPIRIPNSHIPCHQLYRVRPGWPRETIPGLPVILHMASKLSDRSPQQYFPLRQEYSCSEPLGQGLQHFSTQVLFHRLRRHVCVLLVSPVHLHGFEHVQLDELD